jgi:hypothetical protein
MWVSLSNPSFDAHIPLIYFSVQTISTKYHKKANFEQQKAFILSTLKYIRGMWASKLGL